MEVVDIAGHVATRKLWMEDHYCPAVYDQAYGVLEVGRKAKRKVVQGPEEELSRQIDFVTLG